ncbi:uncharacterized protein LOC116340859 [Contarinia nasturtii]|uniref:uncharacterized protein LOC116340859 n=1 Tax=Contarinia nasturtii TaxID=265458 RepID=UPI0012D4867D|nr:uncharacterized protein LOC116340859 [Contarinia nasturtii]
MEYEKVKNKSGKYSFKSNDVIENVTMLIEKNAKEIENASSILETTKITDLNTDCMETIFEYLEFNDLLNLAESSKQFYTAVCEVYKRNFASQTLTNNDRKSSSKYDEEKMILIKTNPLKVLRNFGHVIKNFEVDFRWLNAKLCAEIENYLVIYCSDSLQRLCVFPDRSETTFKDLQKPLEKVTYLKIIITLDQNINHIQFLNESNLPNVNKIEIYSYKFNTFGESSKKIHFENIEYFKYYGMRSSKYPFSFGNLKHLRIRGSCQVKDALCEFIGNVKDLKTLQLNEGCVDADSLCKILELQNVLSNLEEIQIECLFVLKFSPGDVLRFLKHLKLLRNKRLHGNNIIKFGC